jgi:DNA polymerase-3 subunit epsilon
LQPLFDGLSGYARLVFFDCETSGLDPEKHQIIELAALELVGDGDGKCKFGAQMSELVRLPEGEALDPKVTEVNGITDEMLRSGGISLGEAARRFCGMISHDEGATLMIAHNAHFDISFARSMFRAAGVKIAGRIRFLDTLTLLKDRREYPHRLENGIEAYGLQGVVSNTHRALDDAFALYELTKAMATERFDLWIYANLFGYNPKYGPPAAPLKGIRYEPQKFHKGIATRMQSLPLIAKQADREAREALENASRKEAGHV